MKHIILFFIFITGFFSIFSESPRREKFLLQEYSEEEGLLKEYPGEEKEPTKEKNEKKEIKSEEKNPELNRKIFES